MPPPESKRRSPWIVWGVVAAVVIAAVLILRTSTGETVEVRTSPVTHDNLLSTVSTNGKVEPVDEFQAHAPAPGVVKQVLVEVGQTVKAGQLLLRLDDSDAVARIAAANASVRSAEASLNDLRQGGSQEERLNSAGDLSRARLQQQQAASSLSALEKLGKQGAASAGEISAAQQRLDTANSTLQSAQQRTTERYSATDRSRSEAQLSDSRAQLAAAQAAYAGSNIRAPFAGTVYSIPVSQYDFVPAGEDLLDLADLDRIQVRAYFDEPEIGKLAVGQAVKIVWDAKPNLVWHGHIEQAPTSVIAYGTRNVGEAVISVDNAHGDLLPNTNVTVTVTTSQRFNVLSIPREGLHTDGASDYVFRILGSRLVRTPVRVGAVTLTRVEILSGLAEKDTVALSALSTHDLTNGLHVKAAN